MNYEEIIQDLKNKKYKAVYFLTGEEPYYIDLIADYMTEHILQQTEKDFNLTILYGLETNVHSIISAARRFPMMAPFHLLVVKEAQQIKDIEKLQPYLEKPMKTTILVICYKNKKLDRRKKFAKLVENNGLLFESAKLYEDKIPDWISNYLRIKGVTIDYEAAILLSEFLGNDLSKIVNELEKLIITLPDRSVKITPAHIERNIGISKDFNNFELARALAEKNVLKANRIIQYFIQNPKNNPATLTITALYYFFSKVILYHSLKSKSNSKAVAEELGVSIFYVRQYAMAAKKYPMQKLTEIVSLLREYDLKTKGVGSTNASEELLKELIFKILH